MADVTASLQGLACDIQCVQFDVRRNGDASKYRCLLLQVDINNRSMLGFLWAYFAYLGIISRL